MKMTRNQMENTKVKRVVWPRRDLAERSLCSQTVQSRHAKEGLNVFGAKEQRGYFGPQHRKDSVDTASEGRELSLGLQGYGQKF